MKPSIPIKPPAKWPFPPQRSGSKAGAKTPGLTRGAVVADICLVAVWGAMIPGLMWFGAAAGF